MQKISYRFVYNRKHRLNAQGQALLQLEAYAQGRKAYFTTHIYLSPLQWDDARQRIRRHPNASALNATLRRMVAEVEAQELAMTLRGVEVTPALLKEGTRRRAPQAFYAFVEQAVVKTSRRPSTLRNRLSTLHALQKFRSQAEWSTLDYAFVDDFEQYLRRSGCRSSTVAKHLKHLRLFINLAIRHGRLPEGSSPFRTYPIPSACHTPVYLTDEELRQMETLAEGADCPEALRNLLDAYLFCCYTGLRYSDFTALTADCLVEEGGATWLKFATVKTGAAVKLPLDYLFEGKALKLWRRHQSRLGEWTGLKSDASANRGVRVLAAQAGIAKHLTFHTARHTFATLLIYKGARITTVQKLLGHRRVTTTEHYGEVLPEGIVRDLMKGKD
jgi:site-specific recombinase XerD